MSFPWSRDLLSCFSNDRLSAPTSLIHHLPHLTTMAQANAFFGAPPSSLHPPSSPTFLRLPQPIPQIFNAARPSFQAMHTKIQITISYRHGLQTLPELPKLIPVVAPGKPPMVTAPAATQDPSLLSSPRSHHPPPLLQKSHQLLIRSRPLTPSPTFPSGYASRRSPTQA